MVLRWLRVSSILLQVDRLYIEGADTMALVKAGPHTKQWPETWPTTPKKIGSNQRTKTPGSERKPQ
jgi:hypothetical protein